MRVHIPALVASVLAGAIVASAGDPPSAPLGFGTAHPGLVEAVDPAGRWIVLCQARADTDHDGKIETLVGYHGDPIGDELVPYLVVGGGEGTALDKFIAVDPTSRYVLGAPKGHVTLYDTRSGDVVDLTPTPTKEGEPTHVEDWASFDDAGRRLLTARVRGRSDAAISRMVVRELESGVDTSLDPGTGLLVRASLSGDGALIDVKVVTNDTDGNGKLEAPKSHGSFYTGGCAGFVSSYSVFGRTGDTPIHRVIAVDGSFRRDVPGFVQFVGRRWIRRLDDGALVLESATGEPKVIAAAALKASVLGSDDASETVLFVSSVGGDSATVFAAGPAGVRETGIRVPADKDARDFAVRRHGRISAIGAEHPARTFDWLKGAKVVLSGKLLASEGAHALVRRDSGLFVLDVDGGTETDLSAKPDHDVYYAAWRAGPLAAAGGFVVDLVHANVVGTYPDPPEYPYPTTTAETWGLRDDGALLRSAGPSASASALPLGPFRWEPPAVPK